MKDVQKHVVSFLLALLFISVSAAHSLAYTHDDKGWIDDHGKHHAFIKHNGHQGYWDHDKNGAKVFITI